MQKTVYNLYNKFFMNEPEGDILNYLKKSNKIIFDVGCYRGNFTKNIIKHELKNEIKSNFFLFDANPNVKNYLNELLVNNRIRYFNLAIDNTKTKKKFTLNQFFEPSGSGLISEHKNDKMYNFTRKTFMQLVQPYKKIKDYLEIDVQTETLDNFCYDNEIKSIDLLKLDTDGNEFNILNGAIKLMSENKIKVIYTEISGTKKNFNEKASEIVNLLKKYNFEHKKIYKMPSFSFLSGLKSTDNLFVSKNNNGN